MSNSATAMLGSTLPPHLSGASPTAYYVNNMVWQNIVESGKKMLAHKNKQGIMETTEQFLRPITILNEEGSGYNELHQVAFMEGADEHMLETVDIDQLDARDHNGNTPLIWAAFNGNEKLVELLVDQGAAVNMQNFVGETALYLAAARGYDRICSFLIENGGETRFATMDGASPLHAASVGGHLVVVKTLASHGAFVNAVDEEGDTPLHYAVRGSQKEIVEYLVKSCGADSGFRNEDLETPLDLAMDLGEKAIIDFLAGCFTDKTSALELPEYHLYFGEENHEMQISKKEHELPQAQQGLFGRSVANY